MNSEYYEYQLTIDKILDSGSRSFPDREIVYRDIRRYTVVFHQIISFERYNISTFKKRLI
ncbi:hypothetical protein [Saccharolobus solfataricus]|uniref:hypothetical protein n=1 Tax=Saccharolobus solfataricus TaxID=2287 RepID=UPI0013DE1780|nr:hypothetical protein [Saccharolobus solfataricus]